MEQKLRDESQKSNSLQKALSTSNLWENRSKSLILFKGNHWWRTALLIISALFVILVGPSRIYLGDHWASDVLGAYLFSGVLLGIALWIYLHLKEKGVLAPRGKRAQYFREKYLRQWKVKDN